MRTPRLDCFSEKRIKLKGNNWAKGDKVAHIEAKPITAPLYVHNVFYILISCTYTLAADRSQPRLCVYNNHSFRLMLSVSKASGSADLEYHTMVNSLFGKG